jgi:MFS family permease
VHVRRGLIIALMALGSVSMWVLNPVLWFWLTSHLQARASQAQMGPYVLLLVGVVGTAIVLAKALAALNRQYGRITGTEPMVRIIVPWRRSLRDARHGGAEDASRLPVSVLDVLMVLSVLAAIVVFAVWFLIVNPTPPGVGPGSSKD